MNRVEIRIGPTGDEQEGGFMNATLQRHREVAFSVATRVKIPNGIDTVEGVASHLNFILRRASFYTSGGLTFEVEVGREHADGEEEQDAQDD